MNAIECLAVLHQENVAMVRRLLRSAETEDDARRRISSDIIFIWPREPGEILTPVSTPTYYYRVRHGGAAEREKAE